MGSFFCCCRLEDNGAMPIAFIKTSLPNLRQWSLPVPWILSSVLGMIALVIGGASGLDRLVRQDARVVIVDLPISKGKSGGRVG